MMGFLDSIFDPPRQGQGAIDNSERNVKARLDYLRYPTSRNGEIVDAAVCNLPRQIEWEVVSQSYGLSRLIEDQSNYPYSVEQRKAALSSREYYKQELTTGSALRAIKDRKPSLFDSYFQPGSENVIIPYVIEPVLTETIQFPEQLKRLAGLDDVKARMYFKRTVKACLCNSDTWKGDRYPYLDPPVDYSVGFVEPEPMYQILYQIEIAVWINGVAADKCNLTHTERNLVICKIQDGNTHGNFLSDGKELAKDIPCEIFNPYEARSSESQDFAKWYQYRYAGHELIQNTSHYRGR